MNSNVVSMSSPQQSGWTWDGQRWVCGDMIFDPDCGPPFHHGFPPAISPPLSAPPWYPGANGGVTFASTAPPNPVRGHFWWNGVILQLFDGAAWVAIGPNAGGTTPGSATGAGVVTISMTQPATPQTGSLWWDGATMRVWDGVAFKDISTGSSPGPVVTTTEVLRLIQPTNVSIPPSTWSIIPYTATPTIDIQGAWNATTHQFMPKKAGYYMFSVQVNVTTNGGGGLALARNDVGTLTPQNADLIAENLLNAGAGTGEIVTAFGVSHFNGTTDFARLWGFTPDGFIVVAANLPSIECWALP